MITSLWHFQPQWLHFGIFKTNLSLAQRTAFNVLRLRIFPPDLFQILKLLVWLFCANASPLILRLSVNNNQSNWWENMRMRIRLWNWWMYMRNVKEMIATPALLYIQPAWTPFTLHSSWLAVSLDNKNMNWQDKVWRQDDVLWQIVHTLRKA